MKGRTLNPNLFAAGVILTAILWGAILHINISTSPTHGLTEVQEVQAEGNAMRVETGCFILNMGVSEEQTRLINAALIGEEPPRPDSHELVLESSKSLNGNLDRVEIHSLKESAYHADLVFEQYFLENKVDARPSDSIILALRDDASVYVDANLLRRHGEFTCESMI